MTVALSQSALNALDRMRQVAAVWKAITDLAIPEADLHTIDRDNLAMALDFLAREHAQATARLEAALHSPAPRAGFTPGTLNDRAHAGHQSQ